MRGNRIAAIIPAVLLCSVMAHAVEVRDVTFTTNNAGKVLFSHRKHIQQKQTANNCKACHDTLYPFKKKASYTMADMEKGKSCGACHDGKGAFALKECARCHQVKEIAFAVKETGTTRFSHQKHLAANPDCTACHPALFAAGHNKRSTMAEMRQGRSCGACHNGKRAFGISACTRCHPVKEVAFAVKQTGTTRFSHRKHLAANPACTACHPALFSAGHNKRSTMAEMKLGKSCGGCHNGKRAFGIAACTRCHPVKEIAFAVKQTGTTRFSHTRHIANYSCGECHTRLYPVKGRHTPVTMARMEKGASCGACHNGTDAFSLKGCTSCHPVKEAAFEVKDAGNVAFSHKKHLEMYTCGDCHPALYAPARSTRRVGMKEMEAGRSCGACHDAKSAFSVKDKCDACHKM
ncbi:cytochrome c3 family protein [Geobacter sp. FeAm09]|uniref:cytochrome c3 family protein n=1 Tax=Geobacter sp. FeAm09 TaxID=2597769 RepID=UPI00143E0ADA|nr:cytochrome c3 family protein [Geobacter sp. FeAm09]